MITGAKTKTGENYKEGAMDVSARRKTLGSGS
jgi:hypothetical protein